ncbi:polyhomeotic-like protein 1 [Polypterus senegalus]|uniref:polyhomeotic-like protein 1 n=1 Tax=Polypterus senegalus TaxID=55291 RepID=UPI0019636C3B|nr:polyhomeotic-like protein 1 [Polypterus senegalus]XP_039619677.1 polyhomeotic-like protein 1 [Polypterus senegalus]XP_039619678.1 polyhomeotic-like protein 1 [Polypterus senegalus]
METDSEQSSNSTNGNTSSGGNTRTPQISQMSPYERQAVQALQALQRQPNAAQYFQQLMLQQQINTAQLQSFAAVQQASLAASRQTTSPTVSTPQPTTTAQATVNLTTSAGGGALLAPRAPGSTSSTQASTLNQSVLLGNTGAGQGQMYLRVNRSLRAPISSQLIFMPGGAAAVATVQQQQQQQQQQHQQQQQQQQQEASTTVTSAQSDTDQVQNLAMRCQPSPAVVSVSAAPGAVQRPSASAVGVSMTTISKSECPVTVTQQSDKKTGADGDSGSAVQASMGINLTRATNSQATLITPGSYSILQPQFHVHQKQLNLNQQTATTPQVLMQSHQQGATQMQGQVSQQQTTTLPSQQQIQSHQPPASQSPSSQISTSQSLHTGTTQTNQLLLHNAQTYQQSRLATSSAQILHPSVTVGLPQTSGAQTLVVQPLQPPHSQIAPSGGISPVPIQPKIAPTTTTTVSQKVQPALKQPPILPAPPAPHVPVQLVGARQSGQTSAQAIGIQQVVSTTTTLSSPSSSSNNSIVGTATFAPSGIGIMNSVCHETQVQQQQIQETNTQQQTTGLATCPLQVSITQQQQQQQGEDVNSSGSSVQQPKRQSTGMVSQSGVYVQPLQLQSKIPVGSPKRKAESDEICEKKSDSPPVLQPVTVGSFHKPVALAEKQPTSDISSVDPSPTGASLRSVMSGLALSSGSRNSNDAKPPQAIVKPQVLTHVIEGFVIQEGAEPFPVAGSVKDRQDGLSSNPSQTSSSYLENCQQAVDTDGKLPMLKCEYCGNFEPAHQFRGSKRFCSMTCAKRYNVSCSHQFRPKRRKMKGGLVEGSGTRIRRRGPRRSSSEIARAKIQGRHLNIKTRSDSSRGSDDNSSFEDESVSISPAPSCSRPHSEQQTSSSAGARDTTSGGSGPLNSELPMDSDPRFLSGNPAHWSVEEVCEFISSLQGCQEVADEFLAQEIDGQALLLLKEEHLMSAMNIKLGPALKICARINMLKDG